MLDNKLFFFNDTATTEIYTLSLHDALPIFDGYFWAINNSDRMVISSEDILQKAKKPIEFLKYQIGRAHV